MSTALRLFSSSEAKVLRPEILIVGGGPAGAALACTLSQSEYFGATADGKQIVMLDGSKLPSLDNYNQDDRVPEPRVVTLSPASLRLLKSIDVLQNCNHKYITPFYDMLVYEQSG